jgi:hypothetical protein
MLWYPFAQRNLSLNELQQLHFHRRIYNHLLLQCHPCLIWPPVLILNLITILLFLLILHQRTWPTNIPGSTPHVHFLFLWSFQRLSPSMKPYVRFYNMLFFFMTESYLPCQTPIIEDHPMTAIHSSSFTFSQLPSIPEASPPCATSDCAKPQRQGIHLTWKRITYHMQNCYFITDKVNRSIFKNV